MAIAIAVDAYDFEAVGNAYNGKSLVIIPVSQIRKITPLKPGFFPGSFPGYGQNPYIYTHITLTVPSPASAASDVYTAETMAQLLAKINA